MEDEEAEQPTEQSLAERESVDREADLWRREPRLNREELNVTRLEETQSMVATASEWLELDSPDEGIRFDSELVSHEGMADRRVACVAGTDALRTEI